MLRCKWCWSKRFENKICIYYWIWIEKKEIILEEIKWDMGRYNILKNTRLIWDMNRIKYAENCEIIWDMNRVKEHKNTIVKWDMNRY